MFTLRIRWPLIRDVLCCNVFFNGGLNDTLCTILRWKLQIYSIVKLYSTLLSMAPLCPLQNVFSKPGKRSLYEIRFHLQKHIPVSHLKFREFKKRASPNTKQFWHKQCNGYMTQQLPCCMYFDCVRYSVSIFTLAQWITFVFIVLLLTTTQRGVLPH